MNTATDATSETGYGRASRVSNDRQLSHDVDGGEQMLPKMIARWVVAAVAVPLAVAGAKKVRDRIEARRGSTRTSRLLRRGVRVAQRVTGRKRRRFGW
jgi:hypothetical protein